ncbi:MAG: ABC transporter permease [Bacteroidetes bacterium]|nr:ABC transporter permease [Bacteroidota bacterium]
MFKLRATILKDVQILTRDKVGLIFMFAMPIILAIVITATQNSTFELVNKNKVPMLLCSKDKGEPGKQLVNAIEKSGMFDVKKVDANETATQIADRMHKKDALIAIIIPEDFSDKIKAKARSTAAKALKNFGLGEDSTGVLNDSLQPITFMYHPVLQQSFRQSIQSSLRGALQMVQTKQVIEQMYFDVNEKQLPDTLENEFARNDIGINEVPVSRDGSKSIPTATQHNVPAWTIFAMFFIVISMGSSIVREKLNGSFIRLKTLPTNYLIALASKQFTYLTVTLLQAAVIFAIGIYLFPFLGLPKLDLPADLFGLFLVSFMCGLCAVSFATCIGVYAQTQEQCNGIGSVSIVLLAAIGGLLVPSFAMPASFQPVIKLSPLHWCLEAYYGLFLEGGSLKDIVANILPLLGITVFIQLLALYGLKRKNLI